MILDYDKKLTPLENFTTFFKNNELMDSIAHVQEIDILDFINSCTDIKEIENYFCKLKKIQNKIENSKNHKINEFLKKNNINAVLNFESLEDVSDIESDNSFIELTFLSNLLDSQNTVSLNIHKKNNSIKKEIKINFNGSSENYDSFKSVIDNCNHTNDIEDSVFFEIFDYLIFSEIILFCIKQFTIKLDTMKSVFDNINFYKDIFNILTVNNSVEDMNDVKNIIENNFIKYENMKYSKSYQINFVGFTISIKGEFILNNYLLLMIKNKQGEIEFTSYMNPEKLDNNKVIHMIKNSILFENKLLKHTGQLEKKGLKKYNNSFDFNSFIELYKLKNISTNF